VSSGVSTLSWLLFLPVSLVLGWLARAYGVPRSGWLLTGAALLVAALLVTSTRRAARVAESPEAAQVVEPAGAAGAGEPVEAAHPARPVAPAPLGTAGGELDELACQELVELVTDYLDGVLPSERMAELEAHLADCDGCTTYLTQIRATIRALVNLRHDPTRTP
jgi:hypothetical protein